MDHAAAITPEFLSLQQALAGRFSLERELGRGGMGIVYLARDVSLDRPVAISCCLRSSRLIRPAARGSCEKRGLPLRSRTRTSFPSTQWMSATDSCGSSWRSSMAKR